jgi:mRNA export factor
MKMMTAPVLDVGWHDDGTKAFIAGADKTAKVWDLAADQMMQVAAHDATVKTCHWVKAPNYTCLMTGEWNALLMNSSGSKLLPSLRWMGQKS